MIANPGWKAMIQLNRLLPKKWCQPCVCCEQRTTEALLCPHCLQACLDFMDQEINLLNYPNIQRMVSLEDCDGLTVASWYRTPINTWLQGVKFNHSKAYQCALNLLAQTLWQRFSEEDAFPVDLVCCMPLHRRRLIRRGYNQVEQIWQGLPLTQTILKRTKHTKPQSELTKAKRKRNLNNAFALSQSVEGKNIVLLEDVITTGATMNAAAKVCKQNGAKMVWAMAISLTPFDA